VLGVARAANLLPKEQIWISVLLKSNEWFRNRLDVLRKKKFDQLSRRMKGTIFFVRN
jgi:hypothetical protein